MSPGPPKADIQVWIRLEACQCDAQLLAVDRELTRRNFEPNDSPRCIVGPVRLSRPG
jgi:hypothetical protein